MSPALDLHIWGEITRSDSCLLNARIASHCSMLSSGPSCFIPGSFACVCRGVHQQISQADPSISEDTADCGMEAIEALEILHAQQKIQVDRLRKELLKKIENLEIVHA